MKIEIYTEHEIKPRPYPVAGESWYQAIEIGRNAPTSIPA